MAVMTTAEFVVRWLKAPIENAFERQRPLPATDMMAGAKGERNDKAA
jgi:hypothetical protein